MILKLRNDNNKPKIHTHTRAPEDRKKSKLKISGKTTTTKSYVNKTDGKKRIFSFAELNKKNYKYEPLSSLEPVAVSGLYQPGRAVVHGSSAIITLIIESF